MSRSNINFPKAMQAEAKRRECSLFAMGIDTPKKRYELVHYTSTETTERLWAFCADVLHGKSPQEALAAWESRSPVA